MQNLKRSHLLIGIGAGIVIVVSLVVIAMLALGVLDTNLPTPVPTLAVLPGAAVVQQSPTATPALTVTVVVIASPTPTPTPLQPLEPTTYVVQEGDVLVNIALAHGVSVQALQAANGITDYLIYPAQTLIIPTDLDLPGATLAPPTLEATLPAVDSTATLPDGPVVHVVLPNETLKAIAGRYGVSVQAIQMANELTSDSIQAGQKLIIPLQGAPSTVVPTLEAREWQPSILEGDLEAAYPLTVERPRYTLHYPPDSLPERELDTVLASVDAAIEQIEGPLGIHLQGHFDVHVADSLFGPPDLALRGRSFSSLRRLFFLWDGSGSLADRQYIITHEMTHTFTWNSIGQPSSVMLHEGVAVFTGMPNLEAAGYIRLEDFCAACYRADHLPLPAAGAPFMGHIYDLSNYFSAGCFVKYLIETQGADKFASLYTTSDYGGIYGMTLGELQNEWLATIEARELPADLGPDILVHYLDTVQAAYERLFTSFGGTPAEFEAYRALDQARIAMLAGRFDEAETHLNEFNALLGGQ